MSINSQMVINRGNIITVLKPKREMAPDEALALAAWLVCVAEPIANAKFNEVLTETIKGISE